MNEPNLLVWNEMCLLSKRISSSCLPTLSGRGQFLSSSYRISESRTILLSSSMIISFTYTSFLMRVSALYCELFAYLNLPFGLNSNSRNSWPNLPLWPTLQKLEYYYLLVPKIELIVLISIFFALLSLQVLFMSSSSPSISAVGSWSGSTAIFHVFFFLHYFWKFYK